MSKATKAARAMDLHERSRAGARWRTEDVVPGGQGREAEPVDAVCTDWPMDELIDHVVGR